MTQIYFSDVLVYLAETTTAMLLFGTAKTFPAVEILTCFE
jgi:hypothetical protein